MTLSGDQLEEAIKSGDQAAPSHRKDREFSRPSESKRQGGRKVNIGREENSLYWNMSYTSEPITTFGNGRLVNVHSL